MHPAVRHPERASSSRLWRGAGAACLLLSLAALVLVGGGAGGDARAGDDRDYQVRVKGPTPDAGRGVQTLLVSSSTQQGANPVEVLLPDSFSNDQDKRYRVLYVLPVETGRSGHYGDGMKEIRKLNIHNKHDVICVYPTFDTLPWYANHFHNERRWHAAYIKDVVVPLIDKHYPTLNEPKGRLLLGYSKSGWGAFSLLLRHPEVFGAAAAWDSPFSYTDYTQWPKGWTDPFGSEERFKQHCPMLQLESRAKDFKDGPPRFVLLGSANFKNDTKRMHEKMTALGIPHIHDDTLNVKHDWHSGWVGPAVEYLMKLDKVSVKGDR